MQPSDKPAFVGLITDALAYWKQPVSEFTLTVWWNACQQFDMEQVRSAVSAHATDPDRGQFAPKVADIVRILQGTNTDRSVLAWGKAFEAMSSVGAYRDVCFDDPVIHAVIEDLGGWPKCCRSDMNELGYMQKRFCDSYRAYSARGHFDYPRKLLGDRSSDELYAKRGLPPPKPALVGDQQRAQLVLERGSATTARKATNLAELLPVIVKKEVA